MGNKRSNDSLNRRKEIFRVHAEHERGLSDEQVRERLESGWVNTLLILQQKLFRK